MAIPSTVCSPGLRTVVICSPRGLVALLRRRVVSLIPVLCRRLLLQRLGILGIVIQKRRRRHDKNYAGVQTRQRLVGEGKEEEKQFILLRSLAR